MSAAYTGAMLLPAGTPGIPGACLGRCHRMMSRGLQASTHLPSCLVWRHQQQLRHLPRLIPAAAAAAALIKAAPCCRLVLLTRRCLVLQHVASVSKSAACAIHHSTGKCTDGHMSTTASVCASRLQPQSCVSECYTGILPANKRWLLQRLVSNVGRRLAARALYKALCG